MDEIIAVEVVEAPVFKERPETDPLAQKWAKRIESAKKHYKSFHARIKHNRRVVSGLDWSRDADSKDFYGLRTNLIQSTISGLLPGIYARNPEIAVQQLHQGRDLKLFCKTLETVTNRYLENADLKKRAKATVVSALTCSIGCMKVIYQKDIRRDPVIDARIQDAQDNLVEVERLMMELNDEAARAEHEVIREQLKQTLAALEEKAEVVKSEGIVIDRVKTENILVDTSVAEFSDYDQANWIAQIVPMMKTEAEGLYGFKLDGAVTYGESKGESKRLFSGEQTNDEDCQICVYEIWDKQTQRVYTMAEGCSFWLREPYSPQAVGKRWYPFFLLPFQTVDGEFVGPSLVDLTERLQNEHNDARNKFNEHRDLIKPGYIASADINERTLKRFSDSQLGEITLIDADGQPIQQAIMPKQHPPIDQSAYDTTAVRVDWEMVTGIQDAARSTVVKPKTATEASIMQQSLSGRISEFRDKVEDYLQEVAQYTAQILIQVLNVEQVKRIMGEDIVGTVVYEGVPVETVKRFYDWPELTKEQVFDMVSLRIRAGSTGMPDKIEKQEKWVQMCQIIQPMINQIVQYQMNGIDATALINLLKESLLLYDDKLEVEDFIPSIKQAEPQTVSQ